MSGMLSTPAVPPDTSVGMSPANATGDASGYAGTGAAQGGPVGSAAQKMGWFASGVKQLGSIANFMGDNVDDRIKNLKAFTAVVKDVGSMAQTMSDSSLMRRMIEHGMTAPTGVFGAPTPQAAARIAPTFSAEAAAQAGQWRGMR